MLCNGLCTSLELSRALIFSEVGGTREPERMEVVRDNLYSLAMPPDPAHRYSIIGQTNEDGGHLTCFLAVSAHLVLQL